MCVVVGKLIAVVIIDPFNVVCCPICASDCVNNSSVVPSVALAVCMNSKLGSSIYLKIVRYLVVKLSRLPYTKIVES